MTRTLVALALLAAVAIGAALADAATNNIFTTAGTGTFGYNGDGIAASGAQLNTPTAVTALAGGSYLIADQGNQRVRRVSTDGTITTAAGNGTVGSGGDGGPATAAQLNTINGLAATSDGGFLIADSGNHRVRRVALDGTISTVAGTGAFGYNGDGIPATSAQLNFPSAVASTPDGGFLIADNDNHRIRRVSPGGTISTVAGTGSPGPGGDGGPATSAQLDDPTWVSLMPDGGFLIADLDNHRVRRVTPDGNITTVAGTGTPSFGGDGGPATQAQLNNPIAAVVAGDGSFLVTDRSNERIRGVAPDGTINTVAGTGAAGYNGDGQAATAAQINQAVGLDLNGEGDFLIADTLNHRVRLVDAGDPPAVGPGPPVLGRSVNVARVRGRVRVAVAPVKAGAARAAQKGLRFVPLTAVRQVPVGSFLDTRRGTVRLESATLRAGRTQAGLFSGGVFRVLQSRSPRARGLTALPLKGSSFRRCRARHGRRAAVARHRRIVRRLRANARGRFRTRGRHSAATVRGTIWITTDRCDGTLTTVRRGRVAVRDFRRKRTIVVRAGKRYLARPR